MLHVVFLSMNRRYKNESDISVLLHKDLSFQKLFKFMFCAKTALSMKNEKMDSAIH